MTMFLNTKESGRIEIHTIRLQDLGNLAKISWYIYEKLVASGAPVYLACPAMCDSMRLTPGDIYIKDGFSMDFWKSEVRQSLFFTWKKQHSGMQAAKAIGLSHRS